MNRGLIFNIPDDLPLMQALSPRPATLPVRELQRRLRYLSICIEYDKVPDAKGRARGVNERGRREWESVPVPPELEKKMAGLAEAVVAVRELLKAGEIGKAGERMVGIEALVADMARRADPDRARGKKVLAGAILGKEMGGRKAKVPTTELIDYYEASPKHTVGKTAQHFGMLSDTVKKRLQREKKK